LALLPIGAYEPRWFTKAVHMNPAEAVQAHLDLEASQTIGMHFGTFQLTTEGIDDPVCALTDACQTRNVPPSRFRALWLRRITSTSGSLTTESHDRIHLLRLPALRSVKS
jgi:Beta-lactamase superfamily domain